MPDVKWVPRLGIIYPRLSTCWEAITRDLWNEYVKPKTHYRDTIAVCNLIIREAVSWGIFSRWNRCLVWPLFLPGTSSAVVNWAWWCSAKHVRCDRCSNNNCRRPEFLHLNCSSTVPDICTPLLHLWPGDWASGIAISINAVSLFVL